MSHNQSPIDRRTVLIAGAAAAGLNGLSAAAARAAQRAIQAPRRTTAFDEGWRFWRGDPAGGERVDLDDHAWRSVDLPHDWSIEDLPGAPKTAEPWTAPSPIWSPGRTAGASSPKTPFVLPSFPAKPTAGGPPLRVGPFDPHAAASGWGTGWMVGGAGWYRKTFVGPQITAGERLEIRFDGAFSETEVWLNEVKLGSSVYGYGSFAFDLTPHLRPGRANVLAVRVVNEGQTARWYSGSGINRHVWLTTTGAVRLAPFGVGISTPRVTVEAADVEIEIEVENHLPAETPLDVVVRILDPAGRLAGETRAEARVASGARASPRLSLQLARPQLWGPQAPRLYTAEVSLLAGGRLTDRLSTRFGVRQIAVSAKTGLTINDEPVKLKGACVHSDNGFLGTAAIDAAEVRKVELLKSHGYNAIRLAHHMFPPRFLEACDEVGMLVIDEVFDVWEQPKVLTNDFSHHFKDHWRETLTHMVRRDRNHPSVIFWSIGNEIPERNEARGVEIAAELRQAILAIDRTRPITAAINGPTGREGEPARRSLDVTGYNYRQSAYEEDHARYPDLVLMGTEQYAKDIHDGWRKVEAYPWLLGEFVWSGIDYLGEVGAGSSILQKPGDPPPQFIFVWDYPAYQSGCGEIDILGRRKPQGLYRDVLWNRSPLELLVQRPTPPGTIEGLSYWGWHDELESWTWAEPLGKPMTVRAYTSGDEVRLLLNGREVGRKPVTAADKLTATFEVPYATGELTAVALRNGREIGRKRLVTVGPPAQVRLQAERARIEASPNALAYVFAEVCDAAGRKTPDAAVDLTFALEGAGRLRATGSANPRGIESFSDPRTRTFHGVALAIVQGTRTPGRAVLRVSSPGLAGDALPLQIGRGV
jgi:beta-galactosidase